MNYCGIFDNFQNSLENSDLDHRRFNINNPELNCQSFSLPILYRAIDAKFTVSLSKLETVTNQLHSPSKSIEKSHRKCRYAIIIYHSLLHPGLKIILIHQPRRKKNPVTLAIKTSSQNRITHNPLLAVNVRSYWNNISGIKKSRASEIGISLFSLCTLFGCWRYQRGV